MDVSKLLNMNQDDLVEKENRPKYTLGNFRRVNGEVYCFYADCTKCDFEEKCKRETAEVKIGMLPNIRENFIAPDGWTIVSIDYKNIEVRVAAILANEEVWIRAFNSGMDLHTATARSVFNKQDIVKGERKLAKSATFCALFGGGYKTIARNTGVSDEQAKHAYDSFFAGLRGLADWMEKQKHIARTTKKVSTFFGRERNLEPYYASGVGKQVSYADRTALNHPIQGTAADIMKIALVRVVQLLNDKKFKDKAKLVMTIHDELIYLIRDEVLDDMIPKIVKVMKVHHPDWRVEMEVDVEVGKDWGHLEDYVPGKVPEKKVVETEKVVEKKEPSGIFDFHLLEDVYITEGLLQKIKSAISKSPGDKLLRLHTKYGVALFDESCLVDPNTFLEHLA